MAAKETRQKPKKGNGRQLFLYKAGELHKWKKYYKKLVAFNETLGLLLLDEEARVPVGRAEEMAKRDVIGLLNAQKSIAEHLLKKYEVLKAASELDDTQLSFIYGLNVLDNALMLEVLPILEKKFGSDRVMLYLADVHSETTNESLSKIREMLKEWQEDDLQLKDKGLDEGLDELEGMEAHRKNAGLDLYFEETEKKESEDVLQGEEPTKTSDEDFYKKHKRNARKSVSDCDFEEIKIDRTSRLD